MLVPTSLTAAGVVAWLAWRRRRVADAEADCARRLPLGDGGLVAGAHPIALEAGPGTPAALLVHGAGDTPQTLRYLAERLHARGFTVRAPLLPGHGRLLRDFADVDAERWLAHVRAELDRLRAAHPWTAVVGLSMGGALSVRLAAERPELSALALVAPYLAMPAAVERAARLAAFWGPLVPYVRSSHPTRPSILDEEERARSLGFGWFSPAALRGLADTVRAARAALPRIVPPTLVVQSREDNRIHPEAAAEAFARLGTAVKAMEWVGGAHVLTVDVDRERVAELVLGWLDAQGARAALAARPSAVGG